MRYFHLLFLSVMAAATFAACGGNPSTVQTDLGGPYTIGEFTENSAYYSWYKTGYDAYPDAANQARFDAAVAQISAELSKGEHTYEVVMVTKPNCGCQHTQREMPRVMKTLVTAGLPESNVDIFITDTRLAGIDSIKTLYNIVSSEQVPAFIIIRDGQDIGRVVQEPTEGKAVEEDLAAIFATP